MKLSSPRMLPPFRQLAHEAQKRVANVAEQSDVAKGRPLVV